jgi:propionyl-CoA synthetase
VASYEDTYRRSLADPEGFWAEAAEQIHWYRRWDKVLDDSNPPFYRWFTGGMVNTCYNAIDRHVEDGRGDQAALFPINHCSMAQLRSPVTNPISVSSCNANRKSPS